MKKFTLFLLTGLLAFAMSASAQQVTVRTSNNYELAIDGRTYTGNTTVSNLSQGYHEVRVYEVKDGFLGIGKKRTLINTSGFQLRNYNMNIDVNQNGQLNIYEDRYDGNNNPYGGTYGKDGSYSKGNKSHGKGWGPYNNPGRGHKYGLYKNKNKKNKNHDRDERDERDDD